MPEPRVLLHRSPDQLAAAVCARLVSTLVDAQSSGRVPSWVLTGGSIADRIHEAVADSPARDVVDWSQVELWWGDERFLPDGDPERNHTQARRALLDALSLDPARVHPMAPSDQAGDDPDRAASAYADELATAAHGGGVGGGDTTPTFDVLMLGVGPDGHVASLFPGRPELDDERTAVAVRDSPKLPPTRTTLTMPVLRRAREVWFVVTGEEKARAAQQALAGADVTQVPAAGPSGRQSTLWFLDRPAASLLPPS